MEEAVPTVNLTGVGSRFISSNEVETARTRREEQWKAAYARLGQEPPPRPTEDAFDGRSLAEKLAANRAAKQEEWEEKTKLANQFRALEEDEIMFLDSIREKEAEAERLRKAQDGEELQDFKKAVKERESALNKASTSTPAAPQQTSKTTIDTPQPSKPSLAKKETNAKKSLKGVLMKKKPKPAADAPKRATAREETKMSTTTGESTNDAEDARDTKRRKISTS